MAIRLNVKPVKEYTFIREDDWGCYNEKGMFLKGTFDKDGYCKHNKVLCDDGKHHNLMEHNMKWIFFNGEIPEGKVIDHIIPVSCGGTNKLSNLRLVTPEENANNPITRKNISVSLKGKNTWTKGRKHTEESKKKMSETRKGKKSPFFGKRHSEEAKKKMSETKSRKIVQITKDGEKIVYSSATEAGRKNGFDNSSISKACNGMYMGKNIYKNSQLFYYDNFSSWN